MYKGTSRVTHLKYPLGHYFPPEIFSFVQTASFHFHHLLIHLVAKQVLAAFPEKLEVVFKTTWYGQSKPTAHRRYENNTDLRRKGALKAIGRSDIAETCTSLAAMSSGLRRAKRFTHLARSDHNLGVNVYGYMKLCLHRHRTEEDTSCYKSL